MSAAYDALREVIAMENMAPVAMKEAAAVAWTRYCMNNMHLGLKAWALYQNTVFRYSGPAAFRLHELMMATGAWNSLKNMRRRG